MLSNHGDTGSREIARYLAKDWSYRFCDSAVGASAENVGWLHSLIFNANKGQVSVKTLHDILNSMSLTYIDP